MSNITLPTIHLNGSGRARLDEQYQRAYDSARETLAVFRALDVHDRDYYPQGPDAGTKARAEHTARCRALEHIVEDMLAHVLHLHPVRF